jgi:homoserine dehydrogenase
MANYNRESLEKAKELAVGVLVTGVGIAGSKVLELLKNHNEKVGILSERQDLDEEIAQLSSSVFGKFCNRKKIKEKQSKRDQLKNKYNSYGNGKK